MKGRYHPDWTWKNIWTIMRSNKRSTIVLSCRDCPNGLSPNGKFPRIVSLLSYSLGFLLAMALHDRISYLAAIIAPAGYVSDYLLYTEKPGEASPAASFIKRIMADKSILKGFICHSLWIAGPVKEVFAGRKVTCHNNIVSHVENAGITYCDKDVCVDGDLITARTGGHHGVFAKEILAQIKK